MGYKEFMKQFYQQIDEQQLTNREIALRYAGFWWDHEIAYRGERGGGTVRHITNSGYRDIPELAANRNIALLNLTNSFDYYTNRSMLLSDQLLLFDTSSNHDHALISNFDDCPPNCSAQTSVSYRVFFEANDFDVVGQWIRNNKKVICENRALYLPNLKSSVNEKSWYMGSDDEGFNDEFPFMEKYKQIMARKESMCTAISRAFTNDKCLRAIAEIEIPYIDHVSSEMILKLIEDQSDCFDRLRTDIAEKFLVLYDANGAENFDYITQKISVEIKQSINEIKSEIDKLKRKAFFQVTGAATAMTTATLAAINGAVFTPDLLNQLLLYLGTGGGIISMAKFCESFLNHTKEIKEMPFYFLWLFHKK